MICIFHSKDFDGVCSAAIVRKKYPDVTLIGMDYGKNDGPEVISNLDEGAEIIMVDFCLEPFDRMIELCHKHTLTWIDHHISAIKEHEKSGIEIAGARDSKLAGCELTWQHVFPDEEMPTGVKLLGRYDVWDKASDPRIDPFQMGMKSKYALDPTAKYWDKVIESNDEFINQTCEDGKKIQTYHKIIDAEYTSNCAFEVEFDGYTCLAVNIYPKSHQIFESVPQYDKYDVMLAFGWAKNVWKISLYTEKDNIDCSVIAQKYGGGGHKKAAGFRIDNLPFKLQGKSDKTDESIQSFEAWRKTQTDIL